MISVENVELSSVLSFNAASAEESVCTSTVFPARSFSDVYKRQDLRRDLDQNATLEEFVLTILKGSVIYAPSEICLLYTSIITTRSF